MEVAFCKNSTSQGQGNGSLHLFYQEKSPSSAEKNIPSHHLTYITLYQVIDDALGVVQVMTPLYQSVLYISLKTFSSSPLQ